MSLWTWLTSSGPPPPPIPIEPLPPATEASVEKQGIVGALNSFAFPQPALFAALGGHASSTGVPVTPLTALQAAAVYGCTKCISEDIAGLKIQIRRRLAGGGWVIIENHPLVHLFRRPNRWQTAFQFWSYMLTAYCLRGNSFVVIQRDWNGAPDALVPISPDRVTLQIDPQGNLWYRVNSLHVGFGVLVPADDILHMKNLSLDGYTGISPIACAQDVIGLALAAQQHGAILFRQGGQIGGVLQHPGKLSKEATDNIAQSWASTHTGVQNAHKVAVLEEGMTFEKVAMTNEDAQFLATRQFQVIDICRLFRVPPHKVGELGRSTFGNVEQQQRQYIDDCLHSHTDQLEGLGNDQLLFEDERAAGYDIHFDFTSMLQGDQIQRFQAYQIGLLNGFLSRNEVRARENLNPIAGGDEYRVPLNTADPLHPENIPQQIPPSNGADSSEADDGAGEQL
ncbi:MAG TPA: phage portal protein [Xanthobacteraceae bacterium]|nr:phage portal protein [Xanthobacteraceae bacterium]